MIFLLKLRSIVWLGAFAAAWIVPLSSLKASQDERVITCANLTSGSSWQIRIDFGKATVDSNPARMSDTKIFWHDAIGGGNYTLDRVSGNLTVVVASSTGGYFLQAGWRIKLRFPTGLADTARQAFTLPPGGTGVAAMVEGNSGVRASVGFASETGPRACNEDFAGGVFGNELPAPRQEVVAAIADGIGGAKGGRVAAETAVRGFLDGLWDVPETMEVRRAGAGILNALNRWMHAQGQQDPGLAGMGCTFTALVLRGRLAHLLHVGDTRAYRLSGDRLTCLSIDHVRQDGTGRSHILTRALGV